MSHKTRKRPAPRKKVDPREVGPIAWVVDSSGVSILVLVKLPLGDACLKDVSVRHREVSILVLVKLPLGAPARNPWDSLAIRGTLRAVGW